MRCHDLYLSQTLACLVQTSNYSLVFMLAKDLASPAVMLLYVTRVYVARGRYAIQVIYALLFHLSTLELVCLCRLCAGLKSFATISTL